MKYRYRLPFGARKTCGSRAPLFAPGVPEKPAGVLPLEATRQKNGVERGWNGPVGLAEVAMPMHQPGVLELTFLCRAAKYMTN